MDMLRKKFPQPKPVKVEVDIDQVPNLATEKTTLPQLEAWNKDIVSSLMECTSSRDIKTFLGILKKYSKFLKKDHGKCWDRVIFIKSIQRHVMAMADYFSAHPENVKYEFEYVFYITKIIGLYCTLELDAHRNAVTNKCDFVVSVTNRLLSLMFVSLRFTSGRVSDVLLRIEYSRTNKFHSAVMKRIYHHCLLTMPVETSSYPGFYSYYLNYQDMQELTPKHLRSEQQKYLLQSFGKTQEEVKDDLILKKILETPSTSTVKTVEHIVFPRKRTTRAYFKYLRSTQSCHVPSDRNITDMMQSVGISAESDSCKALNINNTFDFSENFVSSSEESESESEHEDIICEIDSDCEITYVKKQPPKRKERHKRKKRHEDLKRPTFSTSEVIVLDSSDEDEVVATVVPISESIFGNDKTDSDAQSLFKQIEFAALSGDFSSHEFHHGLITPPREQRCGLFDDPTTIIREDEDCERGIFESYNNDKETYDSDDINSNNRVSMERDMEVDEIIRREEVEKEIGSEIERQVENVIENQVENQVKKQVENYIENQIENHIENRDENRIENEIENQFENEIGNQLENEIEKEIANVIDKEAVGVAGNTLRRENGILEGVLSGNLSINEENDEVHKPRGVLNQEKVVDENLRVETEDLVFENEIITENVIGNKKIEENPENLVNPVKETNKIIQNEVIDEEMIENNSNHDQPEPNLVEIQDKVDEAQEKDTENVESNKTDKIFRIEPETINKIIESDLENIVEMTNEPEQPKLQETINPPLENLTISETPYENDLSSISSTAGDEISHLSISMDEMEVEETSTRVESVIISDEIVSLNETYIEELNDEIYEKEIEKEVENEVEKEIDQEIDHEINQEIDQEIDQEINQEINQVINQEINQGINQEIDKDKVVRKEIEKDTKQNKNGKDKEKNEFKNKSETVPRVLYTSSVEEFNQFESRMNHEENMDFPENEFENFLSGPVENNRLNDQYYGENDLPSGDLFALVNNGFLPLMDVPVKLPNDKVPPVKSNLKKPDKDPWIAKPPKKVVFSDEISQELVFDRLVEILEKRPESPTPSPVFEKWQKRYTGEFKKVLKDINKAVDFSGGFPQFNESPKTYVLKQGVKCFVNRTTDEKVFWDAAVELQTLTPADLRKYNVWVPLEHNTRTTCLLKKYCFKKKNEPEDNNNELQQQQSGVLWRTTSDQHFNQRPLNGYKPRQNGEIHKNFQNHNKGRLKRKFDEFSESDDDLVKKSKKSWKSTKEALKISKTKT